MTLIPTNWEQELVMLQAVTQASDEKETQNRDTDWTSVQEQKEKNLGAKKSTPLPTVWKEMLQTLNEVH